MAPSAGDWGWATSAQSWVNDRVADHGPCTPAAVTAATRQVYVPLAMALVSATRAFFVLTETCGGLNPVLPPSWKA